MIEIFPGVLIPDEEIEWSYSRSSGPGGQNVNKVSTKATLTWAIAESNAIGKDVKARFLKKYASKITKAGEIVVSSDEHRSREQNIKASIEKLSALIEPVLKPPKKRKKTKPSRGSVARRLKEKANRSEIKKGRRKVQLD